eukprot:3220696-Amphidinium_carterae.1
MLSQSDTFPCESIAQNEIVVQANEPYMSYFCHDSIERPSVSCSTQLRFRGRVVLQTAHGLEKCEMNRNFRSVRENKSTGFKSGRVDMKEPSEATA